MKYIFNLILILAIAILFAPSSMGINIDQPIGFSEYNGVGSTVLLVGDHYVNDCPDINANLLYTLSIIITSIPSKLTNSDMNDPWMKAGNTKFINHKEGAVLTSKAEFIGESLNMNYPWLTTGDNNRKFKAKKG